MNGGYQAGQGYMSDPPMFFGTGAFVPAGSPVDWWNPDLDTYQDLGVMPAIANNDPIRQINSQSGTGHNLINAGSTVRPLLKLAALNGHSSIVYGASSTNTLGASYTTTTDFTVIMAIKQTTWTIDNITWTDGSHVSAIQEPSTPISEIFVASGVGSGRADQSLTLNTWFIYAFGVEAGTNNNMFSRLNLGSIQVDAYSNTRGNIAGYIIGAGFGSPTTHMEVGCSAQYNTYLTGASLDAAMQSFGTYYGLF